MENLGDTGTVRGWSLDLTSTLWYLRIGFALCTCRVRKIKLPLVRILESYILFLFFLLEKNVCIVFIDPNLCFKQEI